jgi:coenzyme Q-binding protein COQ10
MTVHTVEALVPHAPAALFDLVADVERYPEFVPGWVSARILRREGDRYWTDQVVRVAFLRQRFRTCTEIDPPHSIKVRGADGIFEKLLIRWSFLERPGGCLVHLDVDFDTRSNHLKTFAALLSRAFVDDLMTAFVTRAESLNSP